MCGAVSVEGVSVSGVCGILWWKRKSREKVGSPHPLSPPYYLHHCHHVMPFRIPFAGEGEFFTPDSVLSHCYGALLPMFTTKEATTLRQLCREFKSTGAEFPWEDEDTVITRSVARWRACFPRARWANVSGYALHFNKMGRKAQVTDADFVHLVGVKRLYMARCSGITDAGFVHLRGIHTLDMTFCSQPTITDQAFSHLEGIHALDMSGCWQPTITDLAFSHLKGIHTLNMSFCSQLSITDLAFPHLKGIRTLDMSFCSQPTITGAALQHLGLQGVHLGHLLGCNSLIVSGALEAGLITEEQAND